MQLGARHSLRNGSYCAVRFGRAAHQLHPQHLTRAASGTCRTPDYCNGQRWCHRPASISNLKFVLQIYFGKKLMNLLRRQLLHLAAGAVALPAISSIARAQTYPSRPITIIVPYAAGGATDTIGRVMAERMKSSLGQPVIVEDVTGTAGTIARGRGARAAPDGYNLGLGGTGSHGRTGGTYAPQYDFRH